MLTLYINSGGAVAAKVFTNKTMARIMIEDLYCAS